MQEHTVTDLPPRVGFIGLGDQGAPMARRIVDAGYATTLWARRSASVDSFRYTNARVAASPREVGELSDLVEICVRSDVDVEQVLLGDDGVLAGMSDGGVVAVHSTTHPETCRRLAAEARAVGVSLVDAPVSGGGERAAHHDEQLALGGDGPAVERCRPVFESYGDPVIHVGPVGAGQLAKLVNNLLFTAHLAVATRGYEMAAALGIELGALGRSLACGSARSFALDLLANSGFTAATSAARAGPLLLKDMRILFELADAESVSAPLLRALAGDALDVMGQEPLGECG